MSRGGDHSGEGARISSLARRGGSGGRCDAICRPLDALTAEELSTVLHEAGKVDDSPRYPHIPADPPKNDVFE